jgi:hypothetical protein
LAPTKRLKNTRQICDATPDNADRDDAPDEEIIDDAGNTDDGL